MASGKIKWFQIVTSLVYLSDLIILYALFSLGFPPATALAVKVTIMVGVLFVRLYYAHANVPCIDLLSYTKTIILPLTIATLMSVGAAWVMMHFTTNMLEKVLATIGMVMTTFVFMSFIGLSKSERCSMINLIKKFSNK
jgi:hypothetical protein